MIPPPTLHHSLEPVIEHQSGPWEYKAPAGQRVWEAEPFRSARQRVPRLEHLFSAASCLALAFAKTVNCSLLIVPLRHFEIRTGPGLAERKTTNNYW